MGALKWDLNCDLDTLFTQLSFMSQTGVVGKSRQRVVNNGNGYAEKSAGENVGIGQIQLLDVLLASFKRIKGMIEVK